MAFKVPESARVTSGPMASSLTQNGRNGCFLIASPEPGWHLAFIASDGTETDAPEGLFWEHVSVRAFRWRRDDEQNRCATWREMVFVKQLCWDDEDVVMQLHPRRSQYVNEHPYVLHLWRPRHLSIPEPPAGLVGRLTVR